MVANELLGDYRNINEEGKEVMGYFCEPRYQKYMYLEDYPSTEPATSSSFLMSGILFRGRCSQIW